MKWVPDTTTYDETFDRTAAARAHYRPLVATLESFTQAEIDRRERLQKLSLVDQGITFTVYGEKDGIERIFPFDFVPRIIPAREWDKIEAGLIQRVRALNLFINDVYQDQRCLGEGLQRGHQWPVVRPGGGRAIERLVVGGGVGHPLHGRPSIHRASSG